MPEALKRFIESLEPKDAGAIAWWLRLNPEAKTEMVNASVNQCMNPK